MQILNHEFRKIWGKRTFWMLLGAILFANCILAYTQWNNQQIQPASYKLIYTELAELEPEERQEFVEKGLKKAEIYWDIEIGMLGAYSSSMSERQIQFYMTKYESGNYLTYTENIYSERMLFEELIEEARVIAGYPDYLQEIQDEITRGEEISIFRTDDPYTLKSNQKIRAAYEVLTGNTLTWTNTRGVAAAIDFTVTDICGLLLLFYVIVLLIVQENDKGLFGLLKSMRNGREHLFFSKAAVIVTAGFLISLVLWGGNYILAGFMYGFPDLSVLLQSVDGYIGSSLNISIGTYLALFWATKGIIYTALGFILMLFAQRARHSVFIFMKTLIFIAVSYLVYLVVPAGTVIEILHYGNIIHLIQVGTLYRYYFLVNVAGFPVSMLVIFAVLMILLLAGVIFRNYYVFCKCESVRMGNRKSRLKLFGTVKCRISLWYHELYKSMILHKAALVILGFLAFQVYYYHYQNSTSYAASDYYKQYMNILEGPVTEEKLEYIKVQNARFKEIDKILNQAAQNYSKNKISLAEYNQISMSFQQELNARMSFEMVLERLDYIEKYEEGTGRELWFVYENGWYNMSGNGWEGYQTELTLTLFMTALLAAALSTIYPYEYTTGMYRVLMTYKNGRQVTMRRKNGTALGIMIPLYCIAFIPEFFLQNKLYGLKSLAAPAASLPAMQNFPFPITIWQYFALLYIQKLIVCIAVTYFILWITARFQETMRSLAFICIILCAPLILHLLGIYILDYITMNSFFSGNMLLLNGIENIGLNIAVILISIVVPVGLLVVFRRKLKQEFCG